MREKRTAGRPRKTDDALTERFQIRVSSITKRKLLHYKIDLGLLAYGIVRNLPEPNTEDLSTAS